MKMTIIVSLLLSFSLVSCGSKKKEEKKETAKVSVPSVPAPATLSKSETKNLSQDWSPRVKQVYSQLEEKYGQPNEGTESMFIWYNNGPWKKTVLYNEPGKNILEQVVDMNVPVERMEDLSNFNRSIVVDRTTGEVSSRSDREEMNFLSLNLANEVIEGNKTAMEARREFDEISNSTRAMYMKNLNFAPSYNPNTIEAQEE